MDVALISSQDYRDPEIVERKRAAGDYTVRHSPILEIDGERLAVVLDGHHSYEAARLDGVEPDYVELSVQEHDAIAILEGGDPVAFLGAVQDGVDWRYLDTGQPVW